MSQSVDIIIVNWNAGDQLQDVISSICAHHDNLVKTVVIVDNASTDASLSRLETATNKFPFTLKIVRNGKNLGFGAACNQGAEFCTSNFLLFLNPDTRLFAGSLSRPIEFMQKPSSERVGVLGVQLLDESGRVSRSCTRFPTIGIFLAQAIGINRLQPFTRMSLQMADWAHDTSRQVDHVIGAFYLIRTRLFHKLDGFDERFFVYFEDLDLSLRASAMGYASLYFADSQAFHSGGGTSRQVKAHRLFYSLRSRLLYGFKHFPRWQAWGLAFVTLVIEPLSRTAYCLASGVDCVRDTWRGYGMLYRDLPQILKRTRLP